MIASPATGSIAGGVIGETSEGLGKMDLDDLTENDSLVVVRVTTVNGRLMAETDASISPLWYRLVADQLRDLAESLEASTPPRPTH